MSIWVWCSYHLHILGKFTVDIWQIAFVSANSLTAFGFCKNRLRAEQGIFSLFLIELSKKKEWEPHPLTGPSCITQLSYVLWLESQRKIQSKTMGSLSYCVRVFHRLLREGVPFHLDLLYF